MGFIVVAIAAGVLIGLLRGGSVRNLENVAFRWWPVLVAGLLVQATSSFVGGTLGVALLVASYGVLLAFAAANIRLAGMGLVVVGMAMNASTIAVNGGMPVRASAIVAADIAEWDELDELSYGTKRHLERPDDRLMLLSDIIPVPVLRQVLSFGDLVLSVGVADLIVHLLVVRRRPRGLTTPAPAVEPGGPPAVRPEASARPGTG